MKILLATTNPHKIEEVRALMPSDGIVWLTLNDLDQTIPEPVEDADTFEGNAALKARYYADHTSLITLADDSGLEVDALEGEPGVRSARYSGKEGPRHVVDAANNRALLAKMRGKVRRGARFVCAMALHKPGDDEPWAMVRGTVEGRILAMSELDPVCPEKGRGTQGFGYDPLFHLDALGQTTAQLDPDHKNRISHRGNAARDMWRQLRLLIQSESQ